MADWPEKAGAAGTRIGKQRGEEAVNTVTACTAAHQHVLPLISDCLAGYRKSSSDEIQSN